MPLLPTTPKAVTFADAWAKKFEEVLRQGAGKDGRLTVTEARRIAERVDGGRFFSDNAVNWLNAKGQKSVAVGKLVEEGRKYALAQATQAAGKDGWVSFPDAQKMRSDLRDDFLYLRGKIVDPKQPTPEQFKTDVKDVVLRAFDNETAKKLPGPPAIVKGRRELIEHLPHAPTQTNLRTWIADGRIYVSRAANRPTPLVGWYDVGPMPTRSQMSDLRAKFESATKDLWLTSESDAQVKYIASAVPVSGAVTAELVKQHLGVTHDALGPTLYGAANPNFVKLADRAEVEVLNGYQWLDAQAEIHDPNDAAAVEAAGRWANLASLVRSELSDVWVVRFGTVDITTMLVGQTRTGELAGFMSAVVET